MKSGLGPLGLLTLLNPRRWSQVDPRFLPFADLATADLPLSRLFRLSLFQVSVGMATALLVGTLNRVLIVELGVAAWLVAMMVALPLLIAPFRALVGFRSDTHKSVLGWRRVPYIWMGTILQFGGLAIMPFALILLSGDTHWHPAIGPLSAALAFLLVGAGIQTVQTTGLALATDLASEDNRPRVVALMYTMLLVGMLVSGLVFSFLLADFSKFRLIQVVQGSAFVAFVLNVVALWKQEARNPSLTSPKIEHPSFRETWGAFLAQPGNKRFLLALFMGTAAFSMQDIILEPYGGEILGLSVSATSLLTAIMAVGALLAFAFSARWLQKGINPHRLAAAGALVGTVAFSLVIFAEPLGSAMVFRAGTFLIGFGGGLFSVATLTAAMGLDSQGFTGLALGAWGAVQATAAGLAVFAGGVLRDAFSAMALHGQLGEVLNFAGVGYSMVYHLELILLFATLVAVGPLVRLARINAPSSKKFGLAEFPG
jgi:BCD family chlorophyll transporter-like MFS transporter